MAATAISIAADAEGPSWADLPVSTPGLVLDLAVLDGNLDEMAAIARSAKVEHGEIEHQAGR